MRHTLDALMQSAIADPEAEPALLRALLNVTLFVHRPLSDGHQRLRLVQFTCPDGSEVIPVFTDAGKAELAAQGHVAVFGLQGRTLFEATRGATLMLNPNDTSCTLYPEEIADLLDGRPITRAPVAAHVDGVQITPARPDELWIGRRAAEALIAIDGATSLYQFHAKAKSRSAVAETLLVIGVPSRLAERAARAISAHLHPVRHRLVRGLDVTSFEPEAPVPDWLAPFADEVLWRRNLVH